MLQMILIKILNWLNKNRLTLNADKSAFLFISSRSKNHPNNKKIVLHNNEANFYKYLGLIFDDAMNWKPQIATITKKVCQFNSFNSVLYLIRKFTNENTAKITYYSLIYPHLIYGVQAWGVNYKTNLNQLNIALKASIRIINKKPFKSPSAPLYINSNIPNLH